MRQAIVVGALLLVAVPASVAPAAKTTKPRTTTLRTAKVKLVPSGITMTIKAVRTGQKVSLVLQRGRLTLDTHKTAFLFKPGSKVVRWEVGALTDPGYTPNSGSGLIAWTAPGGKSTSFYFGFDRRSVNFVGKNNS